MIGGMRRGSATAVILAALALGSCTSSGVKALPTSALPSGEPVSQPIPDPLCPVPPSPSPPLPAEGSLPPEIAEVADQVEEVRGLAFDDPVVAETKSPADLEGILRDELERSLPAEEAARQQRTLMTIGAIPAGTDLRQAVIDYASTQIVGFYDTQAKRLVLKGGTELGPYQRFVLAHELTHALDDQRFDLSRLDSLGRMCVDDRAEAFLALGEGDAVATQVRWASQFLSAGEVQQLQDEAASFPPAPETPPFIENTFLFPYPNGQAFVGVLEERGGQEATDAAFREPPVSTEQILHPDTYPSDAPQAVPIEDLSSKLGTGWGLADQQEVGEGFLLLLLQLRLTEDDAAEGADGWDGGLLRTWAKGNRTAVLIRTVWDREREATRFAAAMDDWLDPEPAEIRQEGETVEVLFGSDRSSLEALQAALA